MHANLRRNLRTVLTGCHNNLEKVPSEAATKYVNYFQAHQTLLHYVTEIHNDGKGSSYDRKCEEITDHLINKCQANNASPVLNTSSGYYSDQSLNSPLGPVSGGSVRSANEHLESELQALELEKLKLERRLKEKDELMKANEKLLKEEISLQKSAANQLSKAAKWKDERLQELELEKLKLERRLKETDELMKANEKLLKEEILLQKSAANKLTNELRLNGERLQEVRELLRTARGDLDQREKEIDKLRKTIEVQKDELKAANGELEMQRSTISELRLDLKVKEFESKKKLVKLPIEETKKKSEAKSELTEKAESEKENLLPEDRKTVLQLTELFGGSATLRRASKLKLKNCV